MNHLWPTIVVVLSTLAGGAQCLPIDGANPFEGGQTLLFNGRPQPVTTEISRLGMRQAGEVLEITVQSDQARAAYILRLDDNRDGVGILIDGGPINEPFLHRVARDEELFLFIDIPPGAQANVVLAEGPADYEPPSGQAVVIEIDEGFVAEGLFEPTTDDEDDRQFLAAIEPTVRDGILSRLDEIFEDTPVNILTAGDPRPDKVSVVFVRSDRVAGEGLDAFQTTTEFGLGSGLCSGTVIFGEVLPRGTDIDPGNRNLNDTAAVYTGSFRAPGTCEPGLVLNSASNIINALSLSIAHEIGHLLGLNHTALDGLMAAAPSVGIERPLGFQRSQIVLDSGSGLEIVSRVVQEPQVYFDSIFAPVVDE